MRLTLRGTIRVCTALTLLAAMIAMALVVRTYRRDRASFQSVYTRSVKQRDISDSARKAITTLQDAEVREQNYALTGETAYSEAYADDIREWQDEFGTLEIVAEHDPATPLVQDLSQASKKVLDELALTFKLADAGSRDAALDRIRKGAAIVYLEQSRDIVAKIQQLEGLNADEMDQRLISEVLRDQRRLATAAVALFCLILFGTALLFLETRRKRDLARSGLPGRPPYIATAP